ncbi:DUF6221 family protein [Streptomyces sp. ECR3.8]|uniref:DUF6221 family protein n=1 Tax=Streptomyces sp. ECR3.8 TaxID=3461009 RepID=UPI004041D1EA
MDELVRWLGVQLDEDERISRAATPGPWRDEGGYVTDVGPDGLPRVQVTDHGTQDGEPEEDDPQGRADSAHIARHDPARVLREIDAKRQLLARYEELRAASKEQGLIGDVTEEYQDFLLRLLALPYADRPGYKESWRP